MAQVFCCGITAFTASQKVSVCTLVFYIFFCLKKLLGDTSFRVGLLVLCKNLVCPFKLANCTS